MLKSKVYVVKSARKGSKEVPIINKKIQTPPNHLEFTCPKSTEQHENNTAGCQYDVIMLTQRRWIQTELISLFKNKIAILYMLPKYK